MSYNNNTLGHYTNRSNIQTVNFSGMRYGNLTPGDGDLLFEIGGKVCFMVELKYYATTDYITGQKIMLERMTDALGRGGYTAYAIYATHSTLKDGGDIDADTATVIGYRIGNKMVEWSKDTDEGVGLPLGKFIESILIKLGLDKDYPYDPSHKKLVTPTSGFNPDYGNNSLQSGIKSLGERIKALMPTEQ